MSKKILNALMQLFAIIAHVEITQKDEEEQLESVKGRKVVANFLRAELNASFVKSYLTLFDEFVQTHHVHSNKKDGARKRTSVNSVKILRICSQINKELTQRQKFVVIVRILEFIQINEEVDSQEFEFAITVAESFNISKEEFELLKAQVEYGSSEIIDKDNVLYLSNKEIQTELGKSKIIDGLDGIIRFVYVKSINTLIFKSFNLDELNLNGQLIELNRNHFFYPGSSIRTSKTNPIYYSDLIGLFLKFHSEENIVFDVQKIEYHFPNNTIGLHEFSFREEAGKLIGIMGGSGSGKSTFLNVLNGNLKPTKGKVTINGIDLHSEGKQVEGVLGYISQDDLLIEELTVFQNLFFNTKLCFSKLSDTQITRKVMNMLQMIGLQEAINLKVGSPLDKTISGGQRKRLNIALELIREPSVLFVDEPTSGLSSRDSENIMDLLNELSSKGKLIFVVIHQPSSDIFKMFDRLFILDTGGYIIYDGHPLDAVIYFKRKINHFNSSEPECSSCGNVNPEQIFNIIESRVVDEYGNITPHRKTSPKEWAAEFKEIQPPVFNIDVNQKYVQLKKYNKPNKIKQLRVFSNRDFLKKLSNTQFMLVNFLEAPILAFVLSFFLKFFNTNFKLENYSYFDNVNIPQYIFISVIVALFLGLTVTAEEIIKDKKILKREAFLNLSRNSYLLAKISLMFLISAIQTLSFVLVGNYILEIQGMWLEYWLVLFSISCSANMLGLIISSTFNSEKVIYIIVPIMIIPQLLFSGVIVKFDKLHPFISKPTEVPIIGNLMLTRWAQEALVVKQVTSNELHKLTYKFEKDKSRKSWKRDFWIPSIRLKTEEFFNYESINKEFINTKKLLINEIERESSKWNAFECPNCIKELKKYKPNSSKKENIKNEINYFLEILQKQYSLDIENAFIALDSVTNSLGSTTYNIIKNRSENSSLIDIAQNKDEFDKIIEYKNRFYQKSDPIYLYPQSPYFLNAHFYSPKKNLFGKLVDTFWANIMVIWIMTLFSYIILYFDLFRKTIHIFESNIRLQRKR